MDQMSVLSNFVNRTGEKERFCELLNSGEKPIMIVWGRDGLGKSRLLEWMIHECALRQVQKAEVIWTRTRKYDAYGVMRRIRDDLGVLRYFSPFTELIKYYTEPNSALSQPLKIIIEGNLSVADKASFVDSKVRDVANVIIRDSMFVAPRQDIGIPMEERLIRLTDLFIASLAVATEQQPCWIFLDTHSDKKIFSPEVKSWLWEELFSSFINGKLPNVRVVMCVAPKPSPDTKFLSFLEAANLQPFDRSHVEEYMKKCGLNETLGVDANRRAGMLDVIMLQAKGLPRDVALIVDGLVREQEKDMRMNRVR